MFILGRILRNFAMWERGKTYVSTPYYEDEYKMEPTHSSSLCFRCVCVAVFCVAKQNKTRKKKNVDDGLALEPAPDFRRKERPPDGARLLLLYRVAVEFFVSCLSRTNINTHRE